MLPSTIHGFRDIGDRSFISNNPNKDTESKVYPSNFMSHVQAGLQNDFQLL